MIGPHGSLQIFPLTWAVSRYPAAMSGSSASRWRAGRFALCAAIVLPMAMDVNDD